MKAVNDCKLNALVQKLKAYIANRYAPKEDAIYRKDAAYDLNQTSYTASVKGKIFMVMVARDDGRVPAATVCIDWKMIPKTEALQFAVPGLDGCNLLAIRDSAGVPTFSVNTGYAIFGVTSYV